ncbi:RagB/SusD family nutrient uptake outer membrane protein [Dyadobacter sp. CY261]|uniref:RagB/SusD family nutrient uptake outer membrane protein n=1 Tax=Dyadobacter sp. CY261 TaxID=2907203 RepID=UPI001F2B2E15|nr:RagB/SusD family nutrient uptake outer membrane protein [Dyadobacter sp. CY261]MCF0075410.1 RagB/SusD family nutrient uptake outer membrane protein [Dyadobacter sp. CY261]
MKKYVIWPVLAVLLSCQDSFLDVKPDKALVVPTTLADYQAVLDNFDSMNSPGLNLIAGDEFTASPEQFQSWEYVERQAYLWAEDLYSGAGSSDWDVPYKAVFAANLVLEGADKLSPSAESSNLIGYAYFYRANAFYGLAQQFAQPYEPQSARSQLGIPLKLTTQVTKTVARASLFDTYQQILSDLQQAAGLVTAESVWKNRPSRAAVYALMARVQLAMGDYENAEKSASASLTLSGELVDFNELDTAAKLSFPDSPKDANQEVLYYNRMNFYLFFFTPYYQVDSSLYASYGAGDLRKRCYFDTLADGTVWYKGSYAGSFGFFSGLATDEVYLTRAECYARKGSTGLALSDLNTLLAKRFKKGAFKPLTVNNAEQALRLVIAERKKELVARGLRWADLRRLNKEEAFKTTLRRTVDGKQYVLTPGSVRYTFPIPPGELSGSGIEQNPR